MLIYMNGYRSIPEIHYAIYIYIIWCLLGYFVLYRESREGLQHANKSWFTVSIKKGGHLFLSLFASSTILFILLHFIREKKNLEPHQWGNGQHAHLEWGRSWVRAPVGSNQDYTISICCFSAKHAALRRKQRLVVSKSE